MDNAEVVRPKLLRRFSELALLLVLLAGALWAQTAGGGSASSRDQTPQSQTPAGESAHATQETIISPKEAKELFRSVDEILQFASKDTGLPIKHEVKRRLIKRDEVQTYIEKSMKEDKDAKRLERSAAVLKKFGLIPRDFDLPTFLVAMLREQVAGYYDVKTKTVNLLNWVDRGAAEAGAGARTDARAPGPIVRHREVDEGTDENLITRTPIPAPATSKTTRNHLRGRRSSRARRWWCCSTIRWRRPERRCWSRRRLWKRSSRACWWGRRILRHFAMRRSF